MTDEPTTARRSRVNPSTPIVDNVLAPGQPDAVNQLIARVLRRAHRTAEERNSPNEARAILHIAHSFADELGAANPGFDRIRFIRAATEDPS
jgi:hypothetical protein